MYSGGAGRGSRGTSVGARGWWEVGKTVSYRQQKVVRDDYPFPWPVARFMLVIIDHPYDLFKYWYGNNTG